MFLTRRNDSENSDLRLERTRDNPYYATPITKTCTRRRGLGGTLYAYDTPDPEKAN